MASVGSMNASRSSQSKGAGVKGRWRFRSHVCLETAGRPEASCWMCAVAHDVREMWKMCDGSAFVRVN
jgi:hypothetical protein